MTSQALSGNLLYYGDNLDMPAGRRQTATFKKAPNAKAEEAEQLPLEE
jgi:hypothetical protein